MTTLWVALLRGINVGKAKRIAMADLRKMLEGLGYGDVRTHLQSGNAIFSTTKGSAEALERGISAQIRDDMRMDVKVLVRTATDLSKVVRDNPFVARGLPTSELHVTFVAVEPAPSKLRAIDPASHAPDELEPGDRVIYTRRPNGVMGSNLPDLEKTLGVDATARSWKTVVRLSDIANGTD